MVRDRDASAADDAGDDSDEPPSSRERESAEDSAFQRYPRYRSGSRLRARVLDAGQGAAQFVGFHDNGLDADCELSLAEDGEQRCLPLRDHAQGQIYYLDDKCTEPVFRAFWDSLAPADIHARSSCADAVGSFVREDAGPDDACNEAGRERVYRVGQRRKAATIYVADRLGCEPAGADECLHEVAPLAPDAFVRGRIHTAPEDNDLASDWVAYGDGARAVLAMRDAARDVVCTAFGTPDGDRCLPVDQADSFGLDFVEAQCRGKHVAVDSSRAPCMRARVAMSWKRMACATYELTPHELGPPVEKLFVRSERACMEREPYWFEWMYELGPQLDLASLPELRRVRAGSGRLALQYYSTAAGTPLQYAAPENATSGQPAAITTFYDRELDASCELEPFTDGARRCVPTYRGSRALITDWKGGPHADSACTRRILFVVAPGACTSRPTYVRVLDSAGSGSVEAVHAIAAPLPEPPRQTFHWVEGACSAREADKAGSYYELGEALELVAVDQHLD